MQPSKTRHIHIFWVETWFKYQNNEQNLQIWDVQVSQNAKFYVKTHFVRMGHIWLWVVVVVVIGF